MKNELKSKLLETKKTLEKVRQAYLAAARAEFNVGASLLFSKYLNLVAFSWTQYTPYFNDGDTCVFSVNDYSTRIALMDDADFDSEDVDSSLKEDYDFEGDRHEDIFNDIATFLNTFSDDVFLDLFGDHVEVILSRDHKPRTEEYQHD